MMGRILAVCFDMFDTLANARGLPDDGECLALGVSREAWGKAMWEEQLCRDRGLGVIRTVREMIDRACGNLPLDAAEEQKEAAGRARLERLKKAVTGIDPAVVETVRRLKESGLRIGLISNADVCDTAYWDQSPLFPLFDDAVFSCDVGLVKPDAGIYLLSLSRLGVRPEEAVFVGDGGSDEMRGAKSVGMKTICTEYMIRYPLEKRKKIRAYADRTTADFRDLPELIRKMGLE